VRTRSALGAGTRRVYKIEHRPDKNMYHIDTLSRYPIARCNIIERQKDGLITRLNKAQEDDSDVKKNFGSSKIRSV